MTTLEVNEPPGQPGGLTIRGQFVEPNGTPIVGATVHEVFLGDPPSNCGTSFDLEQGPAHTDAAGEFCLTLQSLDESLARQGPPGAWKRGCFLVLAARDARTLGYVIASGEELQAPVRLVALPTADLMGRVEAEGGLPLKGARVEVMLYLLFVGRGRYPNAPVNFWLSRPQQPDNRPQRVTDLVAATGPDGEFVVPQVPMMPGLLRLAVAHPEFATLETDYYPYQPSMLFTLQPSAEICLRVELPDGRPAAGLSFWLEGEPVEANWAIDQDGVTDATGQCAFRSLPAGEYVIRYLGGGELPWAVAAICVATLAKGERREIQVKAVPGSLLCGQVRDSSTGAPIRHAGISIESEAYPDTASTLQTAYTDAQGHFVFDYPVVPGALDLTVYVVHRHERAGQRHKIVVGTGPKTELELRLAVPTY